MKIAIINSAGYWSMGWATDPDSQQDVIGSLQRAGIEVAVFEVGSEEELRLVLGNLAGQDWLVWPNAYHVAKTQGSEQTVWLGDIIDQYRLKMIGSSSEALKNVLAKSHCQQLLEEAQVAIPHFAALNESMLDELEFILTSRELSFPLFVKPDDLSTSKGIAQDCRVENIEQLKHKVKQLGEQYGYPVMVEEFLPGRDITVAVFMTGDKPVILATYYDIEIYDDPSAVLDHSVRMRDWDDGKWLRVVTEPEVLAQVEAVAIPACKAVGINEFTRIDCRYDRDGQIKVFDVNGLPGLENPFSTTVWQMIVKMSNQAPLLAFDTLIALIIYAAANRHGVQAPQTIVDLAENYIAAEAVVTAV